MDGGPFLRAAHVLQHWRELASELQKALFQAHSCDGYNFGLGPLVKDRLHQDPFQSYPPGEGEGHTWLFASIPFPDYRTAETTKLVVRYLASKVNPSTAGCEYPPHWSWVGYSKVAVSTLAIPCAKSFVRHSWYYQRAQTVRDYESM
jgi:hypothetical protein